MLRRRGRAAVFVLLGLIATACGRPAEPRPEPSGPLRVVTTVAPITSLVGSVAGRFARVQGLIPEGRDSHTFDPPPSVARTLARADVVFVNGLQLDSAIERLAQRNRRSGTPLVRLGDRVLRPEDQIYDRSFPRQAGRPNPHLWTSPPLAKSYARVAAETLSAHDPTHAGAYRGNYDRLAAKIDELDAAMRQAGQTVPRPQLLTYHDAFAYFARHFGWTVIAAIQVASFADPSPREVAALVDQVRQHGVPAIFGSEVFPSPVLARIGAETGVRYVDVLRDDQLPGRPGSAEHSWLGLMRVNYITMVTALGGDASALEAVTLDGMPPDEAAYPR